MIKVIRLAAVGLLALPALGAANTPASIPVGAPIPQLCGFGLGARGIARAWDDPSGFTASALARTFPSVRVARLSMERNAARIKGCRGASAIPVPAQFARIGDDRFIVRVPAGGIMFVRHGRAVAMVSQLKPFSMAKLGKLAQSAVLKFGP